MILARVLRWCGGVLLVLAGVMLLTGARWHMLFNTVDAAQPATIDVDFSKTGEYTGQLQQRYEFGHDEGLELRVTPSTGSYEEAGVLTQGFEGNVTIKDGGGRAVFEGQLLSPDNRLPWRRYVAGAIPMVAFRPLAEGDYSIHIQVTKPAPGLIGRTQQVVAKHWLCGCEAPAGFAYLAGGALGVFGLTMVLGGNSAARSARRGTQRQQSLPQA